MPSRAQSTPQRMYRVSVSHCNSLTIISVLNANDIVLAEIAARLNFNQLDVDFSRVGEAMNASDGKVNRLVFMNELVLSVDCHLGRAANHDPVLGAMMVFLQR